MNCTCRNAFKCTRWRECERAATARKIMYANKAEVFYCSSETALYQVARDDDPQRVIKEIKKISDSGFYTIETTNSGSTHLNIITRESSDIAALSNFWSSISSRKEARNIGAYISKPDQMPDLKRLRDTTGLTQISNSWGTYRRLESWLKTERMAQQNPQILTTALNVVISNSLNLERQSLSKIEKNPMLNNLKNTLIDAYQKLITEDKEHVYLASFQEILTREQIGNMLKKITERDK